MSDLKVTQNDIDTFKAYIEDCMDQIAFGNTDWNHSYALAIQALKRQLSKKVIVRGLGQRYCPACGFGGANDLYCSKCGQKLSS